MEILIHCKECKLGKMGMENRERIVVTENQGEAVFTLTCDQEECGNKKTYKFERM